LQCVAVCCSVLQCVAVCCSVLQCVAESDIYVYYIHKRTSVHSNMQTLKKKVRSKFSSLLTFALPHLFSP